MDIEVPTPGSPRRRRVTWLVGAIAAVAFGLSCVVPPFFAGDIGATFTWGLPAMLNGLLFVAMGSRVILRVLGIKPVARIRTLCVAAFGLNAASFAISTAATFFLWTLSRVIEDGSGQSLLDPVWLLVATLVCALITAGSVTAAVLSTRIVDPPKVRLGR